MSVLSGKKIILGVTGGIAAYKSASLVRLLIKAGAQVQVIMTPASVDFVTPLTLSTLSKNPVYIHFFNEDDAAALWNNHVDLGIWADLMIIAPATANTMSKMVNGNCDNLLLATYLSAKCPVYFAPAMDLDMYKHPSTLANFDALKRFGNTMIPAERGELASGLSGEGRMAEPENIISFIEKDLEAKLPLKGKKILITAGPTYEAIDPVRFIGNHSTGKMGFDIADVAASLGAQVVLITGPTYLQPKNKTIQIQRVRSAEDMYNACHEHFQTIDVVIAAAAVADYKPKNVASQKIKKNDATFIIELEKTKDVLASLGAIKKNQFLIGFALETENEIEHAKQKIQKKNLDLVVLNSLNDPGAGFGQPTNKITFIDKEFNIEPHELKSKEEVALDIVNKIVNHYA
ncbi:bifunctional phosphopantothenoylcysteine decarboxylase/phosphopantothenate--cysteine ligase CoaBC [Flavobacterium oreochromis]|uniref:Coenzyme A biosynthesis bifunctional protein CoaBC n=2 Tax=Flavobacterium TaxID=237 RepID=A0A246GD36_9FLAO|nr:bifunctional phosphopantothenoylcysteine decarboxylase/phosphopantothenate--cysteine ligase CoaBC [Flavobacterium oreochromis]OWP77564.1 phosphopantothenoylcysteine decarboxylase [Flavobacterium oreochromis]OWP78049.1 phosphopantothenoylcysteine decarboxylase [Flavobacterium oreochromis]QYS85875.1 bifunctional phosphopantothenoylcysteine decarboxylase/phosphopantothenate--cysteine ligase CoaBC [Flavobacterium oreochromis]